MTLKKNSLFFSTKITCTVIIVSMVFYTLLGFFLVPNLIETQIKKYVFENYKEQLQVESITFNPYTFELLITKLNIPDTNTGGVDKSRISFDKLVLNFEIFPLLFKKISFKEASLVGAQINFSFYRNEKNNWTSFQEAPPDDEVATINTWTVILEKISLARNYIVFRDFTFPTPVLIPLGPINLEAHQISTKLDSDSSLDRLSINLENDGNVTLQGKVGLTPLDINLKILAHKVPLSFVTAYLSDSTYLAITNGFLDLDGILTFKNASLKIDSDAKISNLVVKKLVNKTNILEVENIDFKKLAYSTRPNYLNAEKVTFSNLNTNLILNSDGTLNFKDLIKPSSPDEDPIDENPLTYAVGSVELIDSKLDYSDMQTKPKFHARIHDLDGLIGPISDKANNKIDINLTGMVEDQGRFSSKGNYYQSKKPMDLDLGVKFSNIEMTTFSPYSGYFAGYEIKKGKLFLDLNYSLKNNRILGKNTVRLDNFTLGEKVPSKNSTIWPLKLALALLKDRKGQIKFMLPVEGNADSPEFSYSGAIKTALYNMLINIVAAPFDYLASVFGGANDIKLIEFELKTTQLKANNEIKLDQIVKLLEERPEVKLEILGTCAVGEFINPKTNEAIAMEDSQYKDCGLKRAQMIQNFLVKKKINAERLFVMAGKKNDDSIGLPGGILILKVD